MDIQVSFEPASCQLKSIRKPPYETSAEASPKASFQVWLPGVAETTRITLWAELPALGKRGR